MTGDQEVVMGSKRVQIAQVDEGTRVTYQGQLWMVRGIRDGGVVMTGITRRTYRVVPITTMVEHEARADVSGEDQ